MSHFRLPGPVCRVLGALDIDAGTSCLGNSPVPGSVCGTRLKEHLTSSVRSIGVGHVLKDPETYIGSDSYTNAKGNHECVVFAQKAGGAPLTTKWRPGAHVEPGAALARGTWVATFLNNWYEGHVGAFDSMDKDGTLTLIDQFNSRGSVDRTTYHVKPQSYKGKISNDPSRYYVVLW